MHVVVVVPQRRLMVAIVYVKAVAVRDTLRSDHRIDHLKGVEKAYRKSSSQMNTMQDKVMYLCIYL